MISEVRGSASKFYKADGLGTTRALTSTSGTTTDTLSTDAFGNTVASSGTSPSPFGFVGGVGYQSDSDTGLMLLGHRYYDPSTGRFLSRDPIQDGYNWYTYCNNDPVNAIDPEGLETIPPPPGVADPGYAWKYYPNVGWGQIPITPAPGNNTGGGGSTTGGPGTGGGTGTGNGGGQTNPPTGGPPKPGSTGGSGASGGPAPTLPNPPATVGPSPKGSPTTINDFARGIWILQALDYLYHKFWRR